MVKKKIRMILNFFFSQMNHFKYQPKVAKKMLLRSWALFSLIFKVRGFQSSSLRGEHNYLFFSFTSGKLKKNNNWRMSFRRGYESPEYQKLSPNKQNTYTTTFIEEWRTGDTNKHPKNSL